MSEPMPLSRQLDAREQRRLLAITVGPYVLLAVLVIFTVLLKRSAGGSLLIDLVLCALAAVWVLWMFTLHPAWRVRPRVMAVFFTGFVVLMAALVLRDPWFGFLTPAGYLYAFGVLRWPWRLAGVGAVAMVAGTAQAYGVTKTTLLGVTIYLAILAVNVVPMCGLAWLERNREQQTDQRKQALEEVSEANRRLEATLAENAGLHEQLLAQAREAGVLDERARMAREIHDTLAQGLAGIITQLQAAEQAGQDPAGWRRHVAAATGLARESLSEARRSVDALRPESLETARLPDALADVAERWSALNGVAAQVVATGTVRPIRPEAESALLRTAQEALANVARHAHATRVGLTLSYMDGQVALDVRDDGRGFDPARLGGGVNGRAGAGPRGGGGPGRPAGDDEGPAAGGGPGPAAANGSGPVAANGADGPRDGEGDGPAGGGFGLIAMRQRIEGLLGTLQVESEPGAGTAISACVPAAPAGTRA
jgi:signal transduction histidine kinase